MSQRRIGRAIYCAAAVSSLALSVSTSGATFSWNKTAGGTWATAANWTPSGPPGASDAALFNLGAAYTVNLGTNHSCASLNFGGSQTGTITLLGSGRTLQIGGASFNAGFGTGTVLLNVSTLSQLTGNTLQVDCTVNLGTSGFLVSGGSLIVGVSHPATMKVTQADLSVGVNGISGDNIIGSSLAPGTLTFDSASNGTFETTLHVGLAQPGMLQILNGSALSTRSIEIGPNNAGFFTNSQVVVDGLSSVEQVGASTLSIGAATLNGSGSIEGLLSVQNGSFTSGTGSILVNRGGRVDVFSPGVVTLRGDMSCAGQLGVSGVLQASGRTIQINGTNTAPLLPSNLFSNGSITLGTLNIAANPGTSGAVRFNSSAGSAQSAAIDTTIVGGAGAGSLTVGSIGAISIGSFGSGFGLFGGGLNTGSLVMGKDAGSSGSLDFVGGLVSAGSATIGGAGDAVVRMGINNELPHVTFVAGASAVVSGPLVLGDAPASHASLFLQPSPNMFASLQALNQITVGNAGQATLVIESTLAAGTFLPAGNASLSVGTMQVGSASTGAGMVTQTLSPVTANVIHLGIAGGGSGTYQMNSGSLSAGSIDISSNGTFIYNGGTISGAIGVNGGTLLLAGLIPPQPLTIHTTPTANIFVAGALHSPFNGTGLGLFGGTGTLDNGGNLSGHGTLLAGQTLINSGTFTSFGGEFVVASGAILSNGSTGLLRNGPTTTLRIQTANFTNAGNLEVNAGGAISLESGALNLPAGKNISMLGGVLAAATLSVASGATLQGYGQFDGSLTNSGTASFFGLMNIQGPLTNTSGAVIKVRNAPTLVFGSVSNAGSIVVNSGGTIIFDSGMAAPLPGSGGIDGTGSITVDPSGAMLASHVKQSALTINGTVFGTAIATLRPRAEGGDTSVVNSLSIPSSGFGRLDLTDNQLIIDYSGASPSSSVRANLLAGFAGGAWTGNGITSSIAAAVAADSFQIHKTAIGFGEASTLGIGSFGGVTLDGTALLLRYTIYGDSNLDATVTTSDFTLLASHFNQSTGIWCDGDFNYDGKVNALDFNALAINFGAASGKFWVQGDFNYDGMTNTSDFTLLGSNFNQVLPTPPGLGSLVPEPTCAVALAMIPSLLLRRRGR